MYTRELILCLRKITLQTQIDLLLIGTDPNCLLTDMALSKATKR